VKISSCFPRAKKEKKASHVVCCISFLGNSQLIFKALLEELSPPLISRIKPVSPETEILTLFIAVALGLVNRRRVGLIFAGE